MTFVYLAAMILIAFGIYKLYIVKTPADERDTLFKKKDKASTK